MDFKVGSTVKSWDWDWVRVRLDLGKNAEQDKEQEETTEPGNRSLLCKAPRTQNVG